MGTELSGTTLQVNGIDLYHVTEGAGEPLLLLHGMGGCHEDWTYAGRGALSASYRLIIPDARGHRQSTNPQKTLTHRQCALDALALLDHLGISSCKAIGMSMGGNTLLHMATLQPGRITAMVVVSATMYFPEQAGTIMAPVGIDNQPPEAWASMRQRHHLGDEQIVTLWEQQRALKDSYDDIVCLVPDHSFNIDRLWALRPTVPC